jgi:hypothetical protein
MALFLEQWGSLVSGKKDASDWGDNCGGTLENSYDHENQKAKKPQLSHRIGFMARCKELGLESLKGLEELSTTQPSSESGLRQGDFVALLSGCRFPTILRPINGC